VVGREEGITSPADIRVHQEELTGGGGRREKVIPGMATGEIRRGEGRRRGDPPGEMVIGGERMERGEEAYPGKTTGGDERKTGVEGETDNSIRASKGPVPSIFSSWSFFNSFLPFPGLSLTPFQPIPGPASTSLHPSPVSL
jgi:hypothetical protein